MPNVPTAERTIRAERMDDSAQTEVPGAMDEGESGGPLAHPEGDGPPSVVESDVTAVNQTAASVVDGELTLLPSDDPDRLTTFESGSLVHSTTPAPPGIVPTAASGGISLDLIPSDAETEVVPEDEAHQAAPILASDVDTEVASAVASGAVAGDDMARRAESDSEAGIRQLMALNASRSALSGASVSMSDIGPSVSERAHSGTASSMPPAAPAMTPEEFFPHLRPRNGVNPTGREEINNANSIFRFLTAGPQEWPRYPDGFIYTHAEFARRISEGVTQETGYLETALRETAREDRPHLMALLAGLVSVVVIPFCCRRTLERP